MTGGPCDRNEKGSSCPFGGGAGGLVDEKEMLI